MIEAQSKESFSQEPESCAVRQDFHFAFPGHGQYTPHRLRWGRLVIPSIPSDSGRTEGRTLSFSGAGKPEIAPFSGDFSNISTSPDSATMAGADADLSRMPRSV